jgi:hypothetical protein
MRQGLRLEPLLQAISDFLDDQKDMIEQVRCDLIRGLKNAETGRGGMTPQQILRSLVPMRIKNWDYCELRERIADRCRLRQFTDFYCAGAVWCLSMAAATAASVDTSGVTACALSGWSSDADPVGPNIRARAKGDAEIIGRVPPPQVQAGDSYAAEFSISGSRNGWYLISSGPPAVTDGWTAGVFIRPWSIRFRLSKTLPQLR